jgi:hypothetical protein
LSESEINSFYARTVYWKEEKMKKIEKVEANYRKYKDKLKKTYLAIIIDNILLMD